MQHLLLALALLAWGAAAQGAALQSSFVWCPSAPNASQVYVAFRRNFTLEPAPSSATLHLFADARYFLYVNGAVSARGPCRFDPRSPDYDSLDILGLLRPGFNVIAVLVHNYGPGAINGRIMYHEPGFTAQLEINGAPVLATDANWACNADTEHLSSPVAWSSIPDVIDLRVPIGDWTTPAYDDAGWGRASFAAAPAGSSWGLLQPRALPLPVETSLVNLQLLYPTRMPVAAALPITLRPGDSIQIDFGVMAMAYTTIVIESSNAGNNLQCIYYIGYVGGTPTEDHGVGCDFFARTGNQTFQNLDVWVAHYVVFGFSSGVGTITIRNITVVNRQYPFERAGAFNSSDAALDQTWTYAVNTLVAVTDDAYGSDARERNEWLQDPAQPNWITTSVALVPTDSAHGRVSDARLLRQIVRHAALTQEADGRIHATFPTDRGPSDCHWFIEDYALQWISALRIVFDSTGDEAFVTSMWPVLVRQLNWFANHTMPNGLLLAREYTSFDDAVAYITLQGTALNAFYLRGLRDAAYLGRVVGEENAAAAYDTAAAALVAAINALLWDADAGSYSAGIMPDGTVLAASVHAALLMLERGEVPTARVASVRAFFLANFNNAGVFNVCSNPNYLRQLSDKVGINVPVTFYWVFNVLYAIDTAAGDLAVLDAIRGRWAPMLARNDTGTLWESFEDSESCHNYGALPAWFLSSRVLGVRRDAPAALGQLIIEPHLADLTRAAGAVVTEFGVVDVTWEVVVDSNTLFFSIIFPAGVTQAALRLADTNGTTLVLAGQHTPTMQDGRYATVQLFPVAAPGSVNGSIALLN